jgi:50S ribosomal protein L16 3-hydroxylase
MSSDATPIGEAQLGMPLSDFMRSCWRKRPLLIKGAAEAWPTISEEALHGAAELLARERRAGVRRARGLLAVENIDAADAGLAASVRPLVCAFGCSSGWFDGFLAQPGVGVGAHYDYSDNFVLQHNGTKVWRLAPADCLPFEARRVAALEDGNVAIDMARMTQVREFRVEAGDVLYIPLLWPHEGVADGAPARSLSFVVHPEPGLALIPLLCWLLDSNAAWRQPLPVASADAPRLERHIDQLLDQMAEPSFRRELLRRWIASRQVGDPGPNRTSPSEFDRS